MNVYEFSQLSRVNKKNLTKSKNISSEITRLIKEDSIERSNWLWRAQPLVVTQEYHKKRMIIDYSQTINKFTQLDAYPLPHMQDVVDNVLSVKSSLL